MHKLNLEEYLKYMKDWDLSHKEKIAFLETLETITTHFVRAAFDVTPSQGSCGRSPHDATSTQQ